MCRLQRNRIYMASVGAAIMSRELVSRVLFYLLAFFLFTFSKASSLVQSDDCLELDIGELEDYLSKLNFENVPTINMMIGEFKCPVTALPFGALKSDWARLLLLQKAQPKESIFLKKLGRLFRILVIAYFRMEEHFDVAQFGFRSTSSLNASSVHESTTSVNSRKETKKRNNSMIDSSTEINEIPVSFASSALLNKEEFSSGTIETERTSFTSSDVTSEDKNDNSDTIPNNISSITVVFLPISSQTVLHSTSEKIDENGTVTAFSDVSTEKQKYAEIFNNYPDNNGLNEGTLGMNEHVETKVEQEVISTGNHFIEVENTDSSIVNENDTNSYIRNRLNKNMNNLVTEKNIEFSPIPFNTLMESMVIGSELNKSFPINKFSTISDTTGTTISFDYKKSITKSIKEETMKTTKLIFTTENSVTKSNDVQKHDSKKTSGRGDFPVSYDYTNFANFQENTRLKFRKLENVSNLEASDVKTTILQSRFYSDTIFDNGVTGTTESFNQGSSNRSTDDIFQVFGKTRWNSLNSTVSRNKLKKPLIYKNTPPDNEFWKYIVKSGKVTLTTPTAKPTLMSEMEDAVRSEGSSVKSKKRGSSNTNVEKNFRWFYNFEHEDEKYSSKDAVNSRGIRIECKGKRYNDEE